MKKISFKSILNDNAEILEEVTIKKTLKKNEFLLMPQQPAFVAFYLRSGATRNFMLKGGDEITLQFNFENEIVFPLNSYHPQLLSDEFIQALSEVEYIKLDLMKLGKLRKDIPALKTLQHQVDNAFIFQIARRLRSFQTKTAKERYIELLGNNPKIVRFCKLSHIATYLGINLGSLSRIRRELAEEAKT